MATSSPPFQRAGAKDVLEVIRAVFQHLPPNAIVVYKPSRGRIDVVFGEHVKLVVIFGEADVWTRTYWHFYHWSTCEVRSASRDECETLLRQERDDHGAAFRGYATALVGPDATTKPGS